MFRPAILILTLLIIPIVRAHADLNPLLESSSKYDSIVVEKVLSGDRLLLKDNQVVRLIGLQAPKPPSTRFAKRDEHGFIIKDEDPTTPIEEEVLMFVRRLLEQKRVRLEFDVQRRSDNNELLAYVYLPDGRMANVEIVAQGYADLKLSPPNLKYADRLREAYREARREMRGLRGDW